MLESMERAVFDTTDPTTISIELDSDIMLGRIISGQCTRELLASPPSPSQYGPGEEAKGLKF